MKAFLKTILKFLIFPIVVFLFVIAGYFIFDPFKVLYPYDTYTHTHSDRDYYSIEMLNKNYPKYKYDSFIFGSSRTLAFRASSWKNHLPKETNAYMLDGFGDNIYGIYHKIKYLDSLNIEIKNALIILDVDETFIRDYPRDDFFFYLKHPAIDGSSWFKFYETHFLAYLNPNVIASYYANRLLGLKNKFIYEYIGNIRASVDPVTNELRRDDLEELIKTNNHYYDNKIFYDRADTVIYRDKQINDKQKEWLLAIKTIFDKDNTDYKVIIGPMYTQSKFSDADLELLDTIFGKNRVYDFSGVNEFTKYKQNYYETSHYRPLVGDSIMNYIYTNSK